MRINKFIAQATGLSRRAADKAISAGRVLINGLAALPGQEVLDTDMVTLDGRAITPAVKTITVMLNKPVGYVCSRDGQGGKTVYDLLPLEFKKLKPIGRLDKDSSGLLLLTNDGQLAYEMTHPKFQKQKVYEVELDKPLSKADKYKIDQGIKVGNYISRLRLSNNENSKSKNENRSWIVSMSMGRNRQIRRTFQALGYTVVRLHRTRFGKYELNNLAPGEFTR